MQADAIARSYRRWAPIYDRTFGRVTQAGRHRAAAQVNAAGGSVLEVGIGTGLALGLYAPHVAVTGIDLSPDMLAQAQARATRDGLGNVAGLHLMDARTLSFADESFDHVAAMHIMSVVPEPRRVMAEMARVLPRRGGTVLIANHFARESGGWAMVERLAAPLADALGWHSDFSRAEVMAEPRLKLIEETGLPPFGLMTSLRFRRVD